MTTLDDVIQAFFALIIGILLGYVFSLVFWQLSPFLAVFFILAIAIIVIGILLGLFRRR